MLTARSVDGRERHQPQKNVRESHGCLSLSTWHAQKGPAAQYTGGVISSGQVVRYPSNKTRTCASLLLKTLWPARLSGQCLKAWVWTQYCGHGKKNK